MAMRAFDGPPLTADDVRELLRRNLRVHLSFEEARAIIRHFTHVSTSVEQTAGCTYVVSCPTIHPPGKLSTDRNDAS